MQASFSNSIFFDSNRISVVIVEIVFYTPPTMKQRTKAERNQKAVAGKTLKKMLPAITPEQWEKIEAMAASFPVQVTLSAYVASLVIEGMKAASAKQ